MISTRKHKYLREEAVYRISWHWHPSQVAAKYVPTNVSQAWRHPRVTDTVSEDYTLSQRAIVAAGLMGLLRNTQIFRSQG